MTLERRTRILPAWNPATRGENAGYHCCDLRMVVAGPAGAVQFVLFTGWFLPTDQLRMTNPRTGLYPMPADLGYHSAAPLYDYQKEEQPRECAELEGGRCWYDGSSLNAERIYNVLTSKGSDAVFAELEDYYRGLFEGQGEVAGFKHGRRIILT